MKIIDDVIQGSHEWHTLRQGNVTGTRLKSALGTPAVQKTLMYGLISERMTEPQIDDIGTKAVQRGKEIEPIARKAVIDETGIPFEEIGMMFSDTLPNFGLSPDAVRIVDGIIIGGLELKCPDSKKHVQYLCNDEVPKEYLAQCKAPFLLDDAVEFWLFASFDDRNYERPLFLKTIYREDFADEIEADREKLALFLEATHEEHMKLTF